MEWRPMDSITGNPTASKMLAATKHIAAKIILFYM